MEKEKHKFLNNIRNKSDSRWTDADELISSPSISSINIAADDCATGGIPIISDGSTAYVDGSDTHTLVFGATGAKKTRLIGMPLINILILSGESFIATDPKGELFERTSGVAEDKGYKTIVLDFRNLKNSDLWNPLALIYDYYHNGEKDEAIAMMNDLIRTMTEPQRQGAEDLYWVELGCAHALANLLFFIETASQQEANLLNYANFCTAMSSPDGAEELSRYVADGSLASINLKNVLTNKTAPKAFAGVASTITAMLRPFIIQKTLCQVLSGSSFELKDIGREKTAIYIVVPDEKTTLHFLVTTFIKQAYESMIYNAQLETTHSLPVRLNFVLDEFCNIPSIPDMTSMISAGRSRNMRFFLFVQSLGQLRSMYGEDAETIKGNCENWVFLTSREQELLVEIHNLCGGTFLTSSYGTTSRHPLISISEMQRLRKEFGESLILHGRNYPFITQLPDIDDYAFKRLPPANRDSHALPGIYYYDVRQVIREIDGHERLLLFSSEE